MVKEKHLNLRIDSELLKKFRVAASYEGRSANSQLLIMVRDFVAEYEHKHGAITFPDVEEKLGKE